MFIEEKLNYENANPPCRSRVLRSLWLQGWSALNRSRSATTRATFSIEVGRHLSFEIFGWCFRAALKRRLRFTVRDNEPTVPTINKIHTAQQCSILECSLMCPLRCTRHLELCKVMAPYFVTDDWRAQTGERVMWIALRFARCTLGANAGRILSW